MRKLIVILGSVLLATSVVSTVLAHSNGLTSSVGSPLTGDGEVLAERPSTTGVSGDFVGTAGPLVNASPTGLVAGGIMLCDLEVTGSGDNSGAGIYGAHEWAGDETRVDGESNPEGEVPDGTWDDGGLGGACHTVDHYGHDHWNTPGCGETTDHGTVIGDAPASAGGSGSLSGVFVMAGCDEYSTSGGGTTSCAVGRLFGGDVEGAAQCIYGIRPGNNPGAIFLECGGDSTVDTATSGFVTPTSGFAAPHVSICSPSDASLNLFVFSGADGTSTTVSGPGAGWVATR